MNGTYFMYTPEATIRVTYLTDLALARYDAQVQRYVASTPSTPGHWVDVDPKSDVARKAQDKALKAHCAEEMSGMLLATIERAHATLRERGAPDCEELRGRTLRMLKGAVDEIDDLVTVTRDKARRGDHV